MKSSARERAGWKGTIFRKEREEFLHKGET
jgi:hypothetical protein